MVVEIAHNKKIEHIIEKGVGNGFSVKEILVASISQNDKDHKQLMGMLNAKVSTKTFWSMMAIELGFLSTLFTIIAKLQGWF